MKSFPTHYQQNGVNSPWWAKVRENVPQPPLLAHTQVGDPPAPLNLAGRRGVRGVPLAKGEGRRWRGGRCW
ncbi:hypothetical protein E2C01_083621 [Portunus trituberculatus]|uniref:Uncharacterized protein n=1 Tax=Portunus trituberculatus TaxID=210409 RepID=A0A5B7IXN5_PORTR|nr:hypothetical protein [Portunus trituberculatus]